MALTPVPVRDRSADIPVDRALVERIFGLEDENLRSNRMKILEKGVLIGDFYSVSDGANWKPAFDRAVTYLKDSNVTVRKLIVPYKTGGYQIDGMVNITGCHGLTIEGNGSPLIYGTVAGRPPIGNWYGGQPLYQYVPARYLTGLYRPGDQVVTMSGSGESNSVVPIVGDWIIIKTGNVVPDDYVPICELNRVNAISGNLVTLQYPLNHPYSDMGDGEVYGIAVVNHLVTTDLTLRDLHLRHTVGRACNLLHVARLKVDNCHFSGSGGLSARGRFLDIQMTTDIVPNWASLYRPYHLAIDAGTSDFNIRLQGSSTGTGIVHLHEAIANGTLNVNVKQGKTDPDTAEEWAVVSLLGICRNVKVGGIITNSPRGSGVACHPSSVYPSWGNTGCEISVDIEGYILGAPISNPNDFATGGTNQDVLLSSKINYGNAKIGTPNIGTGLIAGQVLTRPVTLIAISGSSPTSSVENGETVWTCANNQAQGVYVEDTIPAGNWTHALFTLECENVDAPAGNVVWNVRRKKVPAGATLDFTGVQDYTPIQAYDGPGSPRFLRTFRAINNAGKVGFQAIRNGAGGSDTLEGNLKIRRGYITYFNMFSGPTDPIVVSRNVAASSFSNLFIANTAGMVWDVSVIENGAGGTAHHVFAKVIGHTTTPIITQKTQLGDLDLVINGTNVRVTNARASTVSIVESIIPRN